MFLLSFFASSSRCHGLSVVCDHCISWPYLLTFSCMIRQNCLEYLFLHRTQLFEDRQAEELAHLVNHLLHSLSVLHIVSFSFKII